MMTCSDKAFDVFLWALQDPFKSSIGLLSYFTAWVFIIIVLHSLTYKYICLPMLVIPVSITGFWFTYINPRRFTMFLNDRSFNICGIDLCISDILFHHLPMLFILIKYIPYYTKHMNSTQVLSALAIWNTYLGINSKNINKLYGLNNDEKMYILKISFVVFMTVFVIAYASMY
jgi:hypothetical protein